ncbi:Glycosyltransferase involved in cell wall bisynthesis [Halogeometricum rufum]|uniref:Glycosyltransferase involved in cell wall bisynthesis n=1 Tax=Halogeometricum rufum TaxID=553469 RepID=A0A1I6GQT4_9EURY|nr:glycosyltransferase [Halogeometricum rufum]SFR44603.1 Glycosyltransferase involved in cell wall bisynthesis [Halogeometricum rufum]
MQSVAAFTDTYLPTVNGVSYTVQTWRDHWRERDGRMDVVYPGTDEYVPDEGEYPVRSVSFPFYDGFRLGVPRVPSRVEDVDVVHAHTPFALGLSGLRLARRRDLPFVASYHTPTGEYADYLTSRDSFERRIESLSERYERWFFGRADAVLCPSRDTRDHLRDEVGVDTEIVVLSNGIDTDRFAPADAGAVEAFRDRYDLPDGPLVGYTGRHGFEKNLSEFVRAAEGLDATVVFGGDGPAREELESLATDLGVEAHFLGFLPREELPAFYSALDAFVFPSPVETQGLVALEANACGTPVVGVDEGALSDTVDDGVTGYHYPLGDVAACRAAVERVLGERETLSASCLDRRDAVSVEHAVDELASLYDRVCSEKGY